MIGTAALPSEIGRQFDIPAKTSREQFGNAYAISSRFPSEGARAGLYLRPQRETIGESRLRDS